MLGGGVARGVAWRHSEVSEALRSSRSMKVSTVPRGFVPVIQYLDVETRLRVLYSTVLRV